MRKNNVVRWLVLMLPLAALLVFPLDGVLQAQWFMKTQIGQQAPDFTLKAIDGREITLSSYIGRKIIIIFFWGTWDHVSCEHMMPTLVHDYGRFKEKGVEVLAIAVQSEIDDAMRELVGKYEITFPILMDDRRYVANEVYGLNCPLPVMLIIGIDGKLRYTHIGQWDEENQVPFVLEDLIKELPANK